MDNAYQDILGLHRPVHTDDVFSRRHPKMTRLNRAKIFAPFAALAGFEAAIESKRVAYVPRRVLDAKEVYDLNATLNRLDRLTRTGALARLNRVAVRVEFFEVCADRNHEGYGRLGLYRTLTGIVQRVDPVKQIIVVGGRAIPFADIGSVEQVKARGGGSGRAEC